MKTKLLLIALFAGLFQLQAGAAVSVDQMTDIDYAKKQGYSEQTAEMMTVSKSRATGTEFYTNDETAYKNQNKFVRFWRKLYVYTDPAAEDYSFYHHDTDTTPSYTDL